MIPAYTHGFRRTDLHQNKKTEDSKPVVQQEQSRSAFWSFVVKLIEAFNKPDHERV